MKRPPFKMLPARGATLRCDGKFVVGGRASFAWETFLQRRIAGVPGRYEIRLTGPVGPWHKLDWTPEEAEEVYRAGLPKYRSGAVIARLHGTREARRRRGLPVA